MVCTLDDHRNDLKSTDHGKLLSFLLLFFVPPAPRNTDSCKVYFR